MQQFCLPSVVRLAIGGEWQPLTRLYILGRRRQLLHFRIAFRPLLAFISLFLVAVICKTQQQQGKVVTSSSRSLEDVSFLFFSLMREQRHCFRAVHLLHLLRFPFHLCCLTFARRSLSIFTFFLSFVPHCVSS
jgi:hypothetical protein